MRTKLLLCLLAVWFGVTTVSLLVIRTALERHTREHLNSDLHNSLNAFQNLQTERRETLRREAALLADLPSLKALMTTNDSRTIQDGGAEFWQVSGSDLFALLRPDGSVEAFYDGGAVGDNSAVETQVRTVLGGSTQHTYVLNRGRLYEVFLGPLYFGSHTSGTLLGYVVMGYEINDKVAREVSQVAASEVIFCANGTVVSSTLKHPREEDISSLVNRITTSEAKSSDAFLGKEHYLVAFVPLTDHGFPRVQMIVLKSYDEASRYLRRLNEIIASLGIFVLILGSALAVYLSETVTRPLEALASGAHALGSGDFNSRLPNEGAKEIRELSNAFDRMRDKLKQTQQELLEAERLATIGEMASSISHDLRHHLTAVYANAEFLGYSTTSEAERVELLAEIRMAVQDMTELIDSLLLFSRTGRALQPTYESVPVLVDHALVLVKAHPDSQGVNFIANTASQRIEAWIDAKKIERAIYNLLLNACQAAKRDARVPAVVISLAEQGEMVFVRITDNGAGVAESIRKTLFDPFVSEGKQSGVGLGLTLAQRIADEHGGNVSLDQSEPGVTTFVLSFLRNVDPSPVSAEEATHASPRD